ncbi:antitermination protein Q [Enterobacterales bacterium CwR94]|nr:antitermination protein Q [Enterobacterales bacterium CwR94]
MRNIQFILERWGEWSRQRLEMDYSTVAAGFKHLLSATPNKIYCSDRDATCIDRCVGQLKLRRPDEYALLHEHYIKGVPKRALGRKLKLSEGMVRIKFQMAEGFIEGCLAMQGQPLEMEAGFYDPLDALARECCA